MTNTTKTGPIRSQIGPLKHYVTKYITEAKALLDAHDDTPNEEDELRDLVRTMRRSCDHLNSAKTRLQDKLNEWTAMVQELPDEQSFYDDSCAEIMCLLLDGDEHLNDLTARCNDIQEDVDRLRVAVAAQPDASVSPPTQAVPPAGSQPASTQNVGVATTNPTVAPFVAAPVSSHSNRPSAFKAPKIQLPTFSGSYMEFRQFWGIFEANIHKRTDLTNIEKFTYLLTQLQGDARDAIAGVLIDEANYDVAVTLLKSRFDRVDDRLITMLYSEFMRVAVSGKKVEDKQRTLDACERVFRQLESAGEDVNSNKSLVFGLLSKFPAGMVRDLQRYYTIGPNNTLNEVRDGLRKSIFEEEATAGIISDLQSLKTQGGASSGETPQAKQTKDDRKTFYNSSLAVADKRQFKKAPFQPAQLLTHPCECYFCGGQHFNGDCPQYPTATGRMQRLGEVDRCQRCLKKHYRNQADCPFKIKCVYCRIDGDHASALCRIKYPDSCPSAEADGHARNARPNETSINCAANVTAVSSSTVRPALFQTARNRGCESEDGKEIHCATCSGYDE